MADLIDAFVQRQIRDSIEAKEALLGNASVTDTLNKVVVQFIQTYKNGGRALIAGNGGSAADAQHLAAEFVSRFYFDRPGLPALALTTDTSILTAIGNDYGYEALFRRQVEANGQKGDLFVGISTSGNSPNIVEALKQCREMGIATVGLTGAKGGEMNAYCDYCIEVPSTCTPRIQEAHILIAHTICGAVEEAIFGEGL